MGHTIAEIENAMLTSLKASALKDVCKKIDAYKGELSLLLNDIQDFLVPEPSLYTLYLGSEYEHGQGIETQAYALVLVAKKLSEVYDLKEKTHTATYNQDFGLGNLLPFKPTKVAMLLATPDHTAYSFNIETSFPID